MQIRNMDELVAARRSGIKPHANPGRLVAVLVLVSVVLLIVLAVALTGTHPQVVPSEAARKREAEAWLDADRKARDKVARAGIDQAAIESAINTLRRAGAIHSIELDARVVRVSPAVWIGMPIESKQSTVKVFSRYFEIKKGSPRVSILSDRNDQELASYSAWSGMKINL